MISRFFIDRPVFAAVISIVIVLAGLAAMRALPIAQYPEILPPQVSVSAVYPGASSQVIAETVAAPLEQEINGVEGMIYQLSNSDSSGAMSLTVYFEVGRDPDQATIDVNNKVQAALAKLPKVSGSGATQPHMTPGLSRVLDQAEQMASKAGDSYVTVERVLQALAMTKEGETASILKDAGVTPQSLNTAINDLRKGRTADSAGAEQQYDALKKYTRDFTEAAAKEAGHDVKTAKFKLGGVGGGSVYDDRDGMVKLVVDSAYGEILGAHIVGNRACDMIAELVAVKDLEGGYQELARIVHPHPTISEAIPEAARAIDKWAIHA